jgi:hypothetical protein
MALLVLGNAGDAGKGRSAVAALRHGYCVEQHEERLGGKENS